MKNTRLAYLSNSGLSGTPVGTSPEDSMPRNPMRTPAPARAAAWAPSFQSRAGHEHQLTPTRSGHQLKTVLWRHARVQHPPIESLVAIWVSGSLCRLDSLLSKDRTTQRAWANRVNHGAVGISHRDIVPTAASSTGMGPNRAFRASDFTAPCCRFNRSVSMISAASFHH